MSDALESVTIYRIAEETGYSPSTVARVLSGRTPGKPRTRAAVLAAAERLNYQPHAAAKSLAQGRSMGIGVLVQDIAELFFTEVLRGVERGFRDSPYYPMFATAHWRLGESPEALEFLLTQRVSALLVIGGQTPAARLAQLARRLPLMIVARQLEGFTEHCLSIDNHTGAHLATRHLVGLGHRRVAHLAGPASIQDAAERQRGYEAALHGAGLDPDPDLVAVGDFAEASGVAAMETLLARGRPFTAVFAANDQMAYGARLVIHRRGLRVPEDISLVGFDDLLWSAYQIPPLTTVRQPAADMGLAAIRVLLQRLEGNTPTLPTFVPELVVRDSTAPPRWQLP